MTAQGVQRREGDVLDYVPSRRDRHCREGMAIVCADGRAVDTFWNGHDGHVLDEAELATADLRFHLGDFRQITGQQEWLTYAPADRQIVTAQHGLQPTYYVREGAEPDLATQIESARERVAEAEGELHSAEARLGWRREELAKLEGTEPAR